MECIISTFVLSLRRVSLRYTRRPSRGRSGEHARHAGASRGGSGRRGVTGGGPPPPHAWRRRRSAVETADYHNKPARPEPARAAAAAVVARWWWLLLPTVYPASAVGRASAWRGRCRRALRRPIAPPVDTTVGRETPPVHASCGSSGGIMSASSGGTEVASNLRRCPRMS